MFDWLKGVGDFVGGLFNRKDEEKKRKPSVAKPQLNYGQQARGGVPLVLRQDVRQKQINQQAQLQKRQAELQKLSVPKLNISDQIQKQQNAQKAKLQQQNQNLNKQLAVPTINNTVKKQQTPFRPAQKPQTIKEAQNRSSKMTELPRGIVKGATGSIMRLPGDVVQGVGTVGKFLTPDKNKWLDNKFEGMRLEGKEANKWVNDALNSTFDRKGDGFIRDAGDAAGSLGIDIATAIAAPVTAPAKLARGINLGTKVKNAALGTSLPSIRHGVVEGNQQFDQAKEAGKSDFQAGLTGAGAGATQAALEKVGLEKIFKPLGSGNVQRFISRSASEGLQEGAQQLSSNAFEKTYNPEKNLMDDVLYSAALGAAVGGPVGSLTDIGRRNSAQESVNQAPKVSRVTPSNPQAREHAIKNGIVTPETRSLSVEEQAITAINSDLAPRNSPSADMSPQSMNSHLNIDAPLNRTTYDNLNNIYRGAQEFQDIDPDLMRNLPQDATARDAIDTIVNNMPLGQHQYEALAEVSNALNASGYQSWDNLGYSQDTPMAEALLNQQGNAEVMPEEIRYRLDAALQSGEITPEQYRELRAEYGRIFGDNAGRLDLVDSILSPEGQALGATIDNVDGPSDIQLLQNQSDPEATLFHESVHQALNDFMTTRERYEVLQSYNESNAIERGQLSDEQYATVVEDHMANDFIQYVASVRKNEAPQSLSQRIREIFARVLQRIRVDVLNKAEAGTLTPQYRQFYEDLYSGKFATRERLDKGLRAENAESLALKETIGRNQQEWENMPDPGSRQGQQMRDVLAKQIAELTQQRNKILESMQPQKLQDRFMLAGEQAEGFNDAQAKGQVFEGVDGKNRFEISDEDSRINNAEARTLGGMLNHPQLFKQYPELKNVPVEYDMRGDLDMASAAIQTLPNGQIGILVNPYYADKPDKLRSYLLHEVQHIIQKDEGFARGSSPDTALEAFNKDFDKKHGKRLREIRNEIAEIERDSNYRATEKELNEVYGKLFNGDPNDPVLSARADELQKKIEKENSRIQKLSEERHAIESQRISDMEAYERSAGEAEARAVQARADMPMSERYMQDNVWYHGTNTKFDKFDQSKIGSTTDDGIFGRGFYFSNDRDFAAQAPKGGSKHVMEVQPDLKNPLDLSKFKTKKELADYLDMSVDALYQQDEGGLIRPTYSQIRQFTSQAKEAGHDGVIVPHSKYGGKGDELVVFDADSIKQAKPQPTFYDSLDVPKDDLIIDNKSDGKALSIDNGNKELTAKDKILASKPAEYFFGDKKPVQEAVAKKEANSMLIGGIKDVLDSPISDEQRYENQFKKDARRDLKLSSYTKHQRDIIRQEAQMVLMEQQPDLEKYLEDTERYRDDYEEHNSIPLTYRSIPRMRVSDLIHTLGKNSYTNIPVQFRSRSKRTTPLDIQMREYGYSDPTDFLDDIMEVVEHHQKVVETNKKLQNVTHEPELLSEAINNLNTGKSLSGNNQAWQATVVKNRAKKNRSIRIKGQKAKSVTVNIPVSTPASRRTGIDIKQQKSKVYEYVAVPSYDQKSNKLMTELIPMDGEKHQLKNGMVVDKNGKSVGSYLALSEDGTQIAYIEGKPVNITNILGDIEAWGNVNHATWDLDRIIEKNAPDKQTARNVQKFLTQFKDRQEAAMKTALVDWRLQLQKRENAMYKDLKSRKLRKELSADLFRMMERKVDYQEIRKKYGDEYIEKHIKPTITWARKSFDSILEDTNKVLERNGFDPIPRRDNYITHIQEDPTFWQKVGIGIHDLNPLGSSIDSEINPGKTRGGIPDAIVGNTENTGVRRKWNPFAQVRRGSAHQQDFFAAFDSYLEPMLFNQYMTPSASRARTIEKAFRMFEKSQEVQFEQLVKEVGPEQAEKERREQRSKKQLHKEFKDGRTSPLVVAFQEYANKLAGKTNTFDRKVLDSGGTLGEKYMKASRIGQGVAGASAIPGSSTAAVAQSLQVVQSIADNGPKNTLAAAYDMLKHDKKDASDPMRKSNFMRVRYTDASTKRKKAVGKYTEKASIPMEFIERHATEVVWYAAYRQAQDNGLDGDAAIREADLMTKRTVAGRGIGDRPVMFDSKAAGIITQFGLEVNNMRVQYFSDWDWKKRSKFIVAAAVANAIGEATIGQSWLPDYLKAAIDSIVNAFDDEEEGLGEKAGYAAQRFAGETAKFIPGAGLIASMFMDDKMKGEVFGEESDASRYGQAAAAKLGKVGWNTGSKLVQGDVWGAAKEATKILPTGSQINRSVEGTEAMVKGHVEGGSGTVRRTLNQNNPLDWLRAITFGKYSLGDTERTLTKSQSKVFKDLAAKDKESAKNYFETIMSTKDSKNTGGTGGGTDFKDAKDITQLRAIKDVKVAEGKVVAKDGVLYSKDGNVYKSYYKNMARVLGDSNKDEAYRAFKLGYGLEDPAKEEVSTGNKSLDSLLQKNSETTASGKVSKAIAMMSDNKDYKDFPEWAKKRYYKENGWSEGDVQYAALAKVKAAVKLDNLYRPFAKKNSREELIKRLYNDRRQSIYQNYVAAQDSIITALQKEGYLSYAEARALKKVKLGNGGKEIVSSKGSGSGRGRGRGGGKRSKANNGNPQLTMAEIDAFLKNTRSQSGLEISKLLASSTRDMSAGKITARSANIKKVNSGKKSGSKKAKVQLG